MSSGTANAILSDRTLGGYVPQPPIPTVVVEFFQKHLGPVGVRETGSAALLLGTAAVVVWLRALKRRQARWIHDFDVRDAVAGDGFSFVASLKF